MSTHISFYFIWAQIYETSFQQIRNCSVILTLSWSLFHSRHCCTFSLTACDISLAFRVTSFINSSPGVKWGLQAFWASLFHGAWIRGIRSCSLEQAGRDVWHTRREDIERKKRGNYVSEAKLLDCKTFFQLIYSFRFWQLSISHQYIFTFHTKQHCKLRFSTFVILLYYSKSVW